MEDMTFDQQLWNEFSQALSNVPMSLASHQTVLNILANVQREAKIRTTFKTNSEVKDEVHPS